MNDQCSQLKQHKMAQWQNLSDDEIKKIMDVLNSTGCGYTSFKDLTIIFNSNPNPLRAEELEQIETVTIQTQTTKVAKPYYRQREKY